MRTLLLIILLSGCAADKIAHAGIGASTYVADPLCIIAGVSGLGKEIWDSRTHSPEALDAAATYFACVGIRSLF